MNVEQFHRQIINALEVAKPEYLSVADGWAAVIRVGCQGLTLEQKGSLARHLVGKDGNDADTYLIVVSDNNENPVIFENTDTAIAQARHSGASVISRYCFSVYSETGHAVQYNQKPTLHFMPGRGKSLE